MKKLLTAGRRASPLVSLVVASAALAGPTFEEVPDAGSTPATAQPTTGSGPLGRIKGSLTGTADFPDFEDVYIICINDPSSFSATVNATLTTFDTELWLFKIDGTGLLSNNNDPLSFPTIFSRIGNSATDGSGAAVTTPGLYFLAITAKGNVPLAFGQPIFNDLTFNGVEVSGPDGPGGPFQWQNWSQNSDIDGGDYAIDLSGVKFFEPQCDLLCPAQATIDWDAYNCNPFDFNVNGGCTEPGNPLQPLGSLAVGQYRAVCGTIGIETNAGIPITNESDWYHFSLAQPGYVFASLIAKTVGGAPVPNARLTIRAGATCATQETIASASGLACPLTLNQVSGPVGQYVVTVSLDGPLPPGPECPVEYILWIDLRPTEFDACGNPFAGSCEISHGEPGCDDPACCDVICVIDPFCCDVAWDSICVNEALKLCSAGSSVANDECFQAFPIVAGDTTFSTVGATTSPILLPPECDEGFGLNFVNDIWFRFEANATGIALVSTCLQADYDTRLAVYSECPGNGGAILGCSDDAPGCALTSQVSFPIICGEQYRIRIGGYSGSGTGVLTLIEAGPCPSPCPSDLDGDGAVGGADLAILLGAWGILGTHPADLNLDELVDGADLAILLGAWGPCLPAP
jgi:hypothetical protein